MSRATGRPVNDRRGVAVDDVPWRFPCDLTALCIHRCNVRVGVLIEDQDHSSIGINGRCNHPVETVERSQRQLPFLFAFEVISNQTEISEEDKHAFAIGHWSGRSPVIERVLSFALAGAD